MWFYRRRAVELLSDRVDQLNKELEAARQQIARLKGYRTTPNRE
jgi:prefoldin subunit 5